MGSQMRYENFTTRLMNAIDADGRSDRAISLAAGLGENYVNQMRLYGKEPSIICAGKLADALNVSLAYVLLGTEITRRDEEFVQLLREVPPHGRQAVLQLLRSMTA